jgi:hypothetical protein
MIGLVRSLLLILLSLTSLATADNGLEVRGSLGLTAFADDSSVTHALYAGSLRLYLGNRFSIEPELQYLYNSRTDKDVAFIPNLAFDLRRRNARIVPYVIGGVGWIHGIRPVRSVNQTITSVGFGMKAFLTDQLYLSPDFRVGTPAHARFSIALGWVAR